MICCVSPERAGYLCLLFLLSSPVTTDAIFESLWADNATPPGLVSHKASHCPGVPTRANKASQLQASAARSCKSHLPAHCSKHRFRLSVLLETAHTVAPESLEDVTWKRSLLPSPQGPSSAHDSLPESLISLGSLATVIPQVSEVQRTEKQHVPTLHNPGGRRGEYRPGDFLSAPQLLCVFHTPMWLSEVKEGVEGAIIQTQLSSLRILKGDRH